MIDQVMPAIHRCGDQKVQTGRLFSDACNARPLGSNPAYRISFLLSHEPVAVGCDITSACEPHSQDEKPTATLRNFGLKVGMVGTVKFEARIKELVENLPDVVVLVEPLLVVRRALREQVGILHRRLLAIVRDDDVCRRLMTVPGVGPVVALTYRAR
jgi:hypothetical protein